MKFNNTVTLLISSLLSAGLSGKLETVEFTSHLTENRSLADTKDIKEVLHAWNVLLLIPEN